jgi:hypothetical protein
MSRIKNIRELTETSVEILQEIIGLEPGKQLHDFLNHDEKAL